jgi:hypothetical protein
MEVRKVDYFEVYVFMNNVIVHIRKQNELSVGVI